jgi:hypothetical protein
MMVTAAHRGRRSTALAWHSSLDVILQRWPLAAVLFMLENLESLLFKT